MISLKISSQSVSIHPFHVGFERALKCSPSFSLLVPDEIFKPKLFHSLTARTDAACMRITSLSKRQPTSHRSLFWLFGKRLFHETRKYTSGIILTAGVTGLFISLLVLGSSFVSASYRTSGLKGPTIFDVQYAPRVMNISLDMPENISITCGVSDYYSIDVIRLYYSVDFWKTSTYLDGTYLQTNLSGHYYGFVLGTRYVPTTYLFYVWANNSAGYFSFNNNGGSYHSVRLVHQNISDPIDDQDPALLKPVQQVFIGQDNATTTRDPRPEVAVWLNQTSNCWLGVNGANTEVRTGARYYLFQLDSNLTAGLNTFIIYVQQDLLFTHAFNVTRLTTPVSISSPKPGNNSVVYNQLSQLSFKTNDHITCNVTLSGPVNQSWPVTTYLKDFSFNVNLAKNFGNYLVSISAADRYGNSYDFTLAFSFMKSAFPYITVLTPSSGVTIVNTTTRLDATFSEACNVTIQNSNITAWNASFTNKASISTSSIPVIQGWNEIIVNATNAEGNTNSTTIFVQQTPYIIHNFYYDVFVLPGETLIITVSFSTNYTASGSVRHTSSYSTPFLTTPFTISEGNGNEGVLKATILAPSSPGNLYFNFTVQFGPESEFFDQNGLDFYVPVEYLYRDTQGPVARSISLGPSTNVNAKITSNDEVRVLVNMYDVTGIQNVTLVYSPDGFAVSNQSIVMTYLGGGTNGNGNYRAYIPQHENQTVVSIKVISYDILNNSGLYENSYVVNDVILASKVPGVLSTEFEKAITGAISTLLVIMLIIIIVFICIFISINDQNVKREVYREEDRIFILRNVCKLSDTRIKKYYYIEQIVQDSIGYFSGVLIGFFILAPVFVDVVKVTLIAWTFDFHEMFFLSYITLESWVALIIMLFILSSLLLKIIQVDRYVTKMVD